jgi:hypothetical protein
MSAVGPVPGRTQADAAGAGGVAVASARALGGSSNVALASRDTQIMLELVESGLRLHNLDPSQVSARRGSWAGCFHNAGADELTC